MEVLIDGVRYEPVKEVTETVDYFTVNDVFEKYILKGENSEIYRTIQKWFYGKEYDAPWCATSMCWALAQVGMLQISVGGKYDNVYDLYQAMSKKSKVHTNYQTLKRGDIVFLCFGSKFDRYASKHVTAFQEYFDGRKSILGVGGNQSDMIIAKEYEVKNIVGVIRPDYKKGGVTNLNHLPKG